MKSFGLDDHAIMVSLVVSFTLTPMMSSRWLKVKRPTEADHHVRVEALPVVRPHGPRVRAHARLADGASRDRRGGRGAGPCCAFHSSAS